MKDQAKNTNITTKPSTRAFSTMARRPAEGFTNDIDSLQIDMSAVPTEEQRAQWSSEQDAARQLFINTIADEQSSLESLNALQTSTGSGEGHKFPLPELPLPPHLIKKTRYDPVVEQLTNLMMQDGNKATAQRYMAHILETLRTNPPPRINPARPLLPGAPPAGHLPLNPILYLTLAIDSIAPLLRLRVQKGGAGGGASLQIPVPLSLRQRRRTAFVWILDVCSKRKSRGSGKNMFPAKVADEIVSIVQGTSSLWERRNAVHKLAVTARAAVNYGQKGFRK
jgi:small subunit ribosomal protein S7